jgi:hypothetical protein
MANGGGSQDAELAEKYVCEPRQQFHQQQFAIHSEKKKNQ